jgi:dinuclear metal center YbgI/SA1388 family protein
MTIRDFYAALEARLPRSLSCDWDNDGISCCPDPDAHVSGVLISLDPNEDAVEAAIARRCNVLLTHHPMLFRGLKAVDGRDTGSRKVIRLISHGITAMAFHTRLDAADGGVNDILAQLLGLENVEPFGEGDLGRIGDLTEECELDVFSDLIKTKLSADGIRVADGYDTVKRVAVVGGDGKGYVNAAIACGADTYVSGRIGYNVMEEAPERAINLIEAGHYYTEFPITGYFAELVGRIDDSVYVEIADSNMIKIF